uniref:Uncharacterized protein n=1 Tax=Sphaerodactylus townsendi TaxID=933632 RepID=A0ACB8EV81_9SAUR
MDLTLFYPCMEWAVGKVAERGSGRPAAAQLIWGHIYRHMYMLKKTNRVGYDKEVGGFRLSEIDQDRQALLAVNLGGVGASIHERQSREEGLALFLALEGQL